MNKVYSCNEKDFSKLVLKSNSYSEVLRKLDLVSMGGTSSKLLKRRIRELGLSVEHFNTSPSQYVPKIDLEEILVRDSNYSNIHRLKIRLVAEKILEYRCTLCDNTGEWNGKKLTLQLDHINGIHDDHRIENLRFLCPNCHSQTETYAGANKT